MADQSSQSTKSTKISKTKTPILKNLDQLEAQAKAAKLSAESEIHQDPRHVRRMKLVQRLFAVGFDPEVTQKVCSDEDQEFQELAEEILQEAAELDAKIQEFAPERPLADINQVDLAILRAIVWESDHQKTPKKVLIDEAVELAKEFGSDSSPRFVNGVLGKLLMGN